MCAMMNMAQKKTQENPGVHPIPFYAVITGFTHVRPARALCTCDRPPRWWSGWPSRVCVGLVPAGPCVACWCWICDMSPSSGIRSLVLCMVSLCVGFLVFYYFICCGSKSALLCVHDWYAVLHGPAGDRATWDHQSPWYGQQDSNL